MTVTSLGDLSQSYSMRLRNVSLRQEIDKLTQELASGRIADVRDILAGNFNYLTDIERRMDVLQGYEVANTEARLFTDVIQSTLENFQGFGADLAASLLTTVSAPVSSYASDKVEEARSALTGMFGALNTNWTGRYIFSGSATDQPALPDVDVLLDEMRMAFAGITSADDLLTASETWFNDPAGFEALVYSGSGSIAPLKLSDSESLTVDVRAIDPDLRDTLRLTALTALADDPTFGFDIEEQTELFQQAGISLQNAEENVINLRASVGFAQGQIDRIAARNVAEATSLEFAKLDLVNVDPFETATRLEEAQFQLQSLYSVTVRMQQLSLVNFL